MRTRLGLTAIVLAAVTAALVTVAAAYAAYGSPKLLISQAGATTVINASAAVADDATALVSIYIPAASSVTSNQAPGTQIGTARAQVSALALGGALLPLEGPIVVAPPGAVPVASQTACIGTDVPLATWLLQLSAAGQTINLPAYLRATAAGEAPLGAVKLQFCLAPPDLPTDKGGATFGAKFLSAELTLNGVLSPVTSGAFFAAWIPWKAGVGALDTAQFAWTAAGISPGAVTVAAKRSGLGATVTGKVTQGGQPRAGVKVDVIAGVKKTALRKVRTVTTKADGSFSYRARTGTFFRARAVAQTGNAASLCDQLRAAIVNANCINPTVNGFTVTSKVVTKK